MEELIIKTEKPKQVIDITDKISGLLLDMGARNGLINIFVNHTTAALTTADLDEGGTDLDYLDAFEKLIPKLQYRHPHNPSHMPDHILSSIIGTSLTVPVKNGELMLGTWQRLALIEFSGPRERLIIVTFS